MARGWAYRHFVLLFFIMMLAVVVVVFINVAHEAPGERLAEFPKSSSTDDTVWQEPVTESPGFVADALVKQNVELRKKLQDEEGRCRLLEKNTSVQSAIIERQNELIVRMHERLNSYKSDATEVLSPSDWITSEQVRVTPDRVIIEIPFARAGSIIDTNSEAPLINGNTTTIEIRPPSAEAINLGDIIVYYSTVSKELIVHRVVAQGNDDDGWFVIAKGDNNFEPDPEKIRFDQVKSVVVGIIY